MVVRIARWFGNGIAAQLEIGGCFMLVVPMLHGDYFKVCIGLGVALILLGLALSTISCMHKKDVTADIVAEQFEYKLYAHRNVARRFPIFIGIAYIVTSVLCWEWSVPYSGSAWSVLESRMSAEEICFAKTLPLYLKYDAYNACEIIEQSGVDINKEASEYTEEDQNKLDTVMKEHNVMSDAQILIVQLLCLLVCGFLLTEQSMLTHYNRLVQNTTSGKE